MESPLYEMTRALRIVSCRRSHGKLKVVGKRNIALHQYVQAPLYIYGV